MRPKAKKTTEGVVCKDTIIPGVYNGWGIRISGHGFGNTTSHAGKNKLSVAGLTNIKGLVENAIWMDSEVHEHHGKNPDNDYIAFDHKLYALGKDDAGNVALYKITVEELYHSKMNPQDQRFHNLRYVSFIEKVAENIGGSSESQDESQPYTANNASATKYTVADLFDIVKNYDPEYKPNECSEIVNTDGTPKIMYHGSPAQFTIFDKSKAKSSGLYGKGFYFTDPSSNADQGPSAHHCSHPQPAGPGGHCRL